MGDIHGCDELLSSLVASIVADARKSLRAAPAVLVFVGDYVDRGGQSKEVIDRLLELRNDPAFEVRTLKGNHEEALLAFLQDATFGPTWAEFGGAQTLLSYGVRPPALRSQLDEWEPVREAFAAALPARHLAFLAQLELSATYGDFLFVHAGIRPGVRLSQQDEHDLLWIRDEFLYARGPFEKVVVHGHTPEAKPFLGEHRIGIDTGAYATGVLTAVRLEGSDCVTMQQAWAGASAIQPS